MKPYKREKGKKGKERKKERFIYKKKVMEEIKKGTCNAK